MSDFEIVCPYCAEKYEVAHAQDDQRVYGVGYLRVKPNGTLERVDPRLVVIHGDVQVTDINRTEETT